MLDSFFLKSDKVIMVLKISDGCVFFIILWYDKVIVGMIDIFIKKFKIEF